LEEEGRNVLIPFKEKENMRGRSQGGRTRHRRRAKQLRMDEESDEEWEARKRDAEIRNLLSSDAATRERLPQTDPGDETAGRPG
jgi:hypothetical protein